MKKGLTREFLVFVDGVVAPSAILLVPTAEHSCYAAHHIVTVSAAMAW
jgi:hypothetical protein